MSENTKTEVVCTETVMLGNEHVRFLESLVSQLERDNNYKTTKSQIIRILIEASMRRSIDLAEISNEDELRQALVGPDGGEPTRIQKR